ncbi:NHL repeat containing protein [Oopsacas minuta]|uniref:NHL repeat containing protein n=1 Tax=Oopsacas minuta TaxID=111878 RepID=A0AAV7K8W6_9METZ|nr:NHL repeat containing protein [Oopsacas minuta]
MAGHHSIDYTSITAPYKELCMKGKGLGHLKNARGLSIEPVTGMIYVVEGGNTRIQVFSPEGSHQFILHPKFAKWGRVDLWGICINDGIVYVSDYQGGRIFLYTLDGDIITVFAKGFTTNKKMIIKMQQPMGIAINQKGDIYVCEFGANCILILENDSNNHIQTFHYQSPLSIVLRKDGSFIGSKGNLIYGKKTSAIESNQMIYEGIWATLCWFGDFDSNGNIFMSDMKGHQILIYETSSGRPTLLHIIKMTFVGSPMGIAVDRNGRIICVTDSKLHFFKGNTKAISMYS